MAQESVLPLSLGLKHDPDRQEAVPLPDYMMSHTMSSFNMLSVSFCIKLCNLTHILGDIILRRLAKSHVIYTLKIVHFS
jgi:hypothetical protein